VTLTPAGVNKLRQTKRLWREAQDQFEATFGAKRAKEMLEILASLSTSESREAF
jgi:DNA-binding MarR family transcriptional regulator